MKLRNVNYVLTALCAMLLSACAGQSPTPAPVAPVALSMATGAAGGTFVEYGNRLAALISTTTPVTVTSRNSGGSLDNLRCLNEGTCDLALSAMASAFEAWNGLQWTKDRQLRGYSVMMPMYETPFHLATVEATRIKRFEDLAGKKVGVGPKGGANELIFSSLAATLTPRPEVVHGTPTELAQAVIGGKIDAFFFGAGAPVPAYREIAEKGAIVFIPIDGAALANALKTFPYLTTTLLPANTYRGQTTAIPTLGLWNFVLVRDSVPADAVYAMMRTVMGRTDLPTVIHPTAAQTTINSMKANTFLPVHPGSKRYLLEQRRSR
jgi:uncharacterized protein